MEFFKTPKAITMNLLLFIMKSQENFIIAKSKSQIIFSIRCINSFRVFRTFCLNIGVRVFSNPIT